MFVVTRGWPWEGSEVDSVWADEDLTREYVSQRNEVSEHEVYEFEECELRTTLPFRREVLRLNSSAPQSPHGRDWSTETVEFSWDPETDEDRLSVSDSHDLIVVRGTDHERVRETYERLRSERVVKRLWPSEAGDQR